MLVLGKDNGKIIDRKEKGEAFGHGGSLVVTAVVRRGAARTEGEGWSR
jgi:hypothetical protein